MFQECIEPVAVCSAGAAPQASLPITMAVAAQWHNLPGRFDWLADQGFACAYAPDPHGLSATADHLHPYLRRGMAVRYHGYFPGYEIGHSLADEARTALELHCRALDAVRGMGEQVMTVHVGLELGIPLDHGRVVENLTRLVNYAGSRGITISLENLRRGPTSHPETLIAWAQRSGAGITLDVGHAVSSRVVCDGGLAVPEIIDMIGDRLTEVHLYERETDRHHAPRDMAILGPIVEKLSLSGCRWWTIELDDDDDILLTRKLVCNYLEKR